jgi:acylphosphatase
MICRRFIVRGRVQGVFYRASTQQTANRLGLVGWVRNCEDGSVELIACGDEATLVELERWLWRGPDNARVESVTMQEAALQRFDGFRITRE